MNPSQRNMLFGLLASAAKRARRTPDKEFRAEITRDALGTVVSWAEIDADQVSEIKRVLLAIVEPSNLDAQLSTVARRWIFGVESHGLDEPLLKHISTVIFGRSDWRNLPLESLKGFRRKIASTARAKRREKTARLLDFHDGDADALARLPDRDFFAHCRGLGI